MNKTAKFAKAGLWGFVLSVAAALVIVYASQTGSTYLLYAGVVVLLILSLFLLSLVFENEKYEKNAVGEADHPEQDEQISLPSNRKPKQPVEKQAERYNAVELLSKIIPPSNVPFQYAQQYTEKVLQNIAKELDIIQGLIFILNDNDYTFHVSGEYAYFSKEKPRSFPPGENLSGQVAKNREILVLKDIPEGYITILSGLGKSSPRHLIIAPIVHDDECIGVMELASFKPFGKYEEDLFEGITTSMAGKLNELRK